MTPIKASVRPWATGVQTQNVEWILGRLEGFEPSTSRTTIWRYYQLSYSRHQASTLCSVASGFSAAARYHHRYARRRKNQRVVHRQMVSG